jgi:N-acetylmuramoyl-L-alanine amidase
MIVIGLDVHKQSVTAVAVDEAGRPLEEKLIAVGSEELPAWAAALDDERLWAVEDCRQLTRWLERQLLSVGEDVVRVPPKLTVPERRAGRTRGKSDPIDALAIARAAIREPGLSRPRPDERVYREIKLLVDRRDDLVDQRRRTQQRVRWHLFQLDPTYQVPLRMLGRSSHLERVARWLARQDQDLQVRLARELVNSCRQLNRQIAELDLQLEQRVRETAPGLLEQPGCAAVTAAKLLAAGGEPGTAVPRPRIIEKLIPFPAQRKAEMAAYAKRHYGLDTWRLTHPHVIVEHYTANDSFSATWNTFASDSPDPELHELPGDCAHFVIDTDGTIYQLVPLTIMCRHTVGLNYTSIGIEHVGTSDQQILDNPRQLSASLELTLWLAERFHIKLANVIGHNESLSSPYHHENYAAWRCQTHSDWTRPDMTIYRHKLTALASRYGINLGRRPLLRATGC